MKRPKKTGDACIRVLETLKFLYKNNASIQDIINHFEKIDPNNRSYTNEVIGKYINTLRVFGFRFVKEKDKYVLLNSPNRFDFSREDLKALYLLESSADKMPEEKLKEEINAFLQDLEKNFSDNTRFLAHSVTKPDFINFKFDYSKYSNQIHEYEKYFLDGHRIKVVYKNKYGAETSAMFEPKEIKYIENDVFLSVYNPVSAQIQDINFNSIIKIEQLPLKSNPKNMFSSVTFMLKDNLAKVYKLRDSEKLLQLNPDGTVVILNQQEDQNLLLKRLMRYGENCEVLSPKTLREEMKQLVKATLKNYEKKLTLR